MSSTHIQTPPYPISDVPGEIDPGTLPVEPDEGPIPPFVPEDPEPVHIIDPPVNPAPHQAQRTNGQVEAGRCR